MEEHHDLADDLLLGPSIGDALGTHRTNTRHLAKAPRFRFDRVEDFLAEGPNQLLGVDRADTADHAGAKIFLDSVDRCRR
jgi:hypothetical protein